MYDAEREDREWQFYVQDMLEFCEIEESAHRVARRMP